MVTRIENVVPKLNCRVSATSPLLDDRSAEIDDDRPDRRLPVQRDAGRDTDLVERERPASKTMAEGR
jgi:hypothetical protein